MINKLISNKILIYLSSRYGTYALQFIISFAIAAKLGPYYLGVYGFITLVISYFGQVNFGIPHSLNVLLVHSKNNRDLSNLYISNALWFYICLSIIVFILYLVVYFFRIQLNSEYQIDNYLLLIALISILTYINSIGYTILRVRNKVYHLAIVQSLNTVFCGFVILFFSNEILVQALVVGQFAAAICSLLVFCHAKVLPQMKEMRISIHILREIVNKGLFLFIYNSCFYLILISIRTLISGNYSVEDFGSFTFSYTVAHSILLLLESVLTLIFPKIIDVFSTDDSERINNALNKMRVIFISSSHMLVYMAILLFPIVIYILPQYSNAITSMNLIALAILMNTNSYGYSSLLIAQNKEKVAARISFISLVTNVLIGLLLVKVFNVDYSYVIIATLLTYLYFSFMCVREGKKIINQYNLKSAIASTFPIKLLIPYSVAFTISIMGLDNLIYLPIIIYIFCNWNDMVLLTKICKQMVKNPNMADI